MVLTGQRSNTNNLVNNLGKAKPSRITAAKAEAEDLCRQKQHRLDQPDRIALIDAYQAGSSRKSLATRFAIHPTTVDAILTRAGVALRRRNCISVSEIDQAVDLYRRQRLSCVQIGRRLGYDAKTIWKVLRTSGVPMRDTAGLDR